MPFCTQCGNQLNAGDTFCAACGARQRDAAASGGPVGGGSPLGTKGVFDSMTPRTACTLCYIPILGWVPSIILLASARFQGDRTVRFHAFQGLYLFVAWMLVDWVVGPMFSGMGLRIEGLLKLTIIGAWIFMLVKTRQREDYRLPVFGELAERSVLEQR